MGLFLEFFSNEEYPTFGTYRSYNSNGGHSDKIAGNNGGSFNEAYPMHGMKAGALTNKILKDLETDFQGRIGSKQLTLEGLTTVKHVISAVEGERHPRLLAAVTRAMSST